jgi:hypothetical protein
VNADAINQADVDAMLLREWRNARLGNHRAEMQRLSTRAIDKTLAEFKLRGFAGFLVRDVDGELLVEGVHQAHMAAVPEWLRESDTEPTELRS